MGIRAPGRNRRNGLAAFRAVELEVRAALGAGWTLVAIYEEKQARLGMSYAQFARYAQPLRRALRTQEAARGAHVPAAVPLSSVTERKPPAAMGPGPPKGRPEDAAPTLDMDGFAAQTLRNRDLF